MANINSSSLSWINLSQNLQENGISNEEIEEIKNSIWSEVDLYDEDGNEITNEDGTKGDGRLNKDEYKNFIEKLANYIDKIGDDGNLSKYLKKWLKSNNSTQKKDVQNKKTENNNVHSEYKYTEEEINDIESDLNEFTMSPQDLEGFKEYVKTHGFSRKSKLVGQKGH